LSSRTALPFIHLNFEIDVINKIKIENPEVVDTGIPR